jgi:3',5'-cyclic AMP phosphodiesterase CpdA
MVLLFHLSDLHIDAESAGQRILFDLLVETVRREKEACEADHVALFITGDVFDSGTMPPAEAVPLFVRLCGRLVAALGCRVPTVVLPGNHDRRWRGLVGPHRSGLFAALRESVDPETTYVAGCRHPFLAEVIPRSFHGLPADVVAYDSTYLPHGWVSAGGMIRQEDLLQAHAQLGGGAADGPLMLLMHHHLIPTPLTDVSFIDSRGPMPRVARWMLGTALPTLVSNADREELTMTALGAGTALSTLHSFGRAVLLLHGHKHFPTARLVRGLVEGSGDVLMASAGSGGRRERLHSTHDADAARLWPSFNVVRFEGERVEIEAISFVPKRSPRAAVRRDLAKVTRRGGRWESDVVSNRVRDWTKRLERDEACFVLSPSQSGNDEYWDYACERHVWLLRNARLRRYVDLVHPGARSSRLRVRGPRQRIELRVNGVTRYAVADGLCRNAAAARRGQVLSAAFEWVGLLCRYGGAVVSLSLARENASALAPFGSLTDLTTGRERPAPIESSKDEWRLGVSDCPPRTLLRIYWPLEG